MSDEPFKPGQRVRHKTDDRILRCLGEVEGQPGRYCCTWKDNGVPQQAEYDHAELESFQFTGIISVRSGAYDRRDSKD